MTASQLPRGRARLAVLAPMSSRELLLLLDGEAVEVVVPETRDASGLHDVLRRADIVLADYTGQLRLGAAEAALGGPVALVQHLGAGVETVDLAAWAERGVPVANTAGANAQSVAEWCVGGAIAALRSAVWADAGVRRGLWPQRDVMRRGVHQLAGRRVGLVGYGASGQAAARLFAAFGCPVSYWSRTRRATGEESGAVYRELDDLLRTSDVLVIIIALGDQTRGLIDASRLALLPSGAVVVNAARGGILDERALLDGLDSGRLYGAALDVFQDEPLDGESPLRGSDRILLSPHVAGGTVESMVGVLEAVAANVRRALHGEPVVSVVNGVSPLVRWR